MKIDLKYLEEISTLISENTIFQRKTKIIHDKKNRRQYQYYNQMCTCILRIRETSNYLEHFKFNKNNDYQEAFDFYEFINCASIIFGCVDQLFQIFDIKLKDRCKRKTFLKSNNSKISDIEFFKFIRSASSVHPENTDRYKTITKRKFEVYPYALWCKKTFNSTFNEVPLWADIELLGWSSKTKSMYKRYYISINEIYDFLNSIIQSLENVVNVMKEIIANYREKIRCKRLKSEKDFNNYNEYLLYLRRRLLKYQLMSQEPKDGGLLIAKYIFTTNILSDDFKNYIKLRVEKLVELMKTDIEQIDYETIFDELSLYDITRNIEKGHYISEKYHSYLYYETLSEIKNNEFTCFRQEKNIDNDRSHSVELLESIKCFLYPCGEFDIAMNYAELYVITLQRIYEIKKEKNYI